AEVIGVAHRDGGEPRAARLADRELHRGVGGVMAEAHVAVDQRRHRRLAHDLDVRIHLEPPVPPQLVVERQHHHPVRVDAAQVRGDHQPHARLARGLRHAPGREDGVDLLRELRGGDVHGARKLTRFEVHRARRSRPRARPHRLGRDRAARRSQESGRRLATGGKDAGADGRPSVPWESSIAYCRRKPYRRAPYRAAYISIYGWMFAYAHIWFYDARNADYW